MTISRLTWGVKASFRSYVEGAGGSIEVSDGASRAEDGSIVFEAAPGGDLVLDADGNVSGAMRFEGTVTFEAHGGMLKTVLTDLGLEVGSEGLVLTAPDAPLNQDRCEIAKLGAPEIGADGVATLSAEITVDGMYQIADNYPPGTELDPVRLHLG